MLLFTDSVDTFFFHPPSLKIIVTVDGIMLLRSFSVTGGTSGGTEARSKHWDDKKVEGRFCLWFLVDIHLNVVGNYFGCGFNCLLCGSFVNFTAICVGNLFLLFSWFFSAPPYVFLSILIISNECCPSVYYHKTSLKSSKG